jgi:hypothetical protein
MMSSRSAKSIVASLIGAGLLLSAGLVRSAHAQDQNQTPTKESGIGNLIVEVKEAETGEPISQARLTLQFEDPPDLSKLKPPKKYFYSAKTNAQGRYKFTSINKGTIHLYVTMERHQSYGKELQFDKDNQVFEVRLKKPQPLL